ncbi:MAG: acylneuraminate cytidylyltransferase family protein [Nitrospirae bacterium]|nr:acylneuraminate cytidylyltransferase family protein [Nitrospirota bacterium]
MTDRNIIAIIPVKGDDFNKHGDIMLGKKPLAAYTIDAARESEYIKRVIVTTDDERVAEFVRGLGAEAPFIRPPELGMKGVSLESVLKHCIEWLENVDGYKVDIVVLLEITHPFRSPGIIDKVIDVLIEDDLDSVFVASEEKHDFWMYDENGKLVRVGSKEYLPRQSKPPLYREMGGVVCVTKAEFIREGKRLGQKIGLIPVRDLSAFIDTHDEMGIYIAKKLVEES